MPITLAVITSTFPEEERGKATGVWTGVAGGGGILGMFLSAALVDVVGWRHLFILPVALAVVALVMTVRSVPNPASTRTTPSTSSAHSPPPSPSSASSSSSRKAPSTAGAPPPP